LTDESATYRKLGDHFGQHDSVDYGREEWGYTDRRTGTKINMNTVEGYYSVFKRGMRDVY
jgi:hypothetical protein